jgi:formate hydrogenlyase subunit 3/multisubunit Na+/H+ antiporter MnhD subunit
MSELLFLALVSWLVALALALLGRLLGVARGLLALGAFAAAAAAVQVLPAASASTQLPIGLGDHAIAFRLDAEALWLGLFGFLAAGVACLLGTPTQSRRGWIAGAALGLVGALGVFGLQDAVSFLIAWELMSFGGACMLLSEKLSETRDGQSTLFMLALLEVGAIALVAAMLVLAHAAGHFDFAAFPAAAATLTPALRFGIGLLLLIGFGAKLGLLPFYEWFPGAYGSGSGATGALLSGVILNAAYFALARGLTQWLPGSFALGTVVISVAVISAILSILYAFQEEDWRELLSFSSAENAAIAVAALGASLMFGAEGLHALAALAWTVALLHLAGHALAKGAMFLAADGVFKALGAYRIAQNGLLRRSPWLFGVGVVFCGMSLAAMPPQAGFVSEWFTFQTVFQGFHMPNLAGRLVLALAGTGLALTAAIAFATFVKVVGIGAQGNDSESGSRVPTPYAFASGVLGLLVLALAVGMPWWLQWLDAGVALRFGEHAPAQMRDGFLLVPLTAKFAFISPTLLVVVCPLLALIPVLLLWLTGRRHPVRRAPVWYGGFARESTRVATTALTFSNAMRVFYSFVYRPTLDVAHEHHEHEYFVRRVHFDHAVAPVFGPLLFRPLTRGVLGLAERMRPLQSGHMNTYLALVGLLLVMALLAAAL